MPAMPMLVHDAVVFPGCTERLKIVDPVSIAMVRSCMSEKRTFGCIPMKAWRTEKVPVYAIGTEVEVLAIEERGREVEVSVLGRRRLKVVEAIVLGGHPAAYTIEVDDMRNPSDGDEISMLRQDISGLFERFAMRFPGRLVPLNEEVLASASDEEFSFIIAGHVIFSRGDRVLLLEMTSTKDRLRREVDCMKAMPPVQGTLV